MRRQYFTLTELLVVMAIIMVLAGLVFPAVSSSRTTAKAAACLSNQKQVITAIIQSMNANKNHFYSPTYTGTDNGADNATVRWTARLYNRKYLPDYSVMRCPEVVYPHLENKGFEDDALTYGAIHADLSSTKLNNPRGFDFRGSKFLKNSSKDAAPSQLMFGACSWNVQTRSGGALLDITNSDDFTDAPYGKLYFGHRGAVNMFFYDGHVAAVNGEKVKTKNYSGYGDLALGKLRIEKFPYYVKKDTTKDTMGATLFNDGILGAWK